VREIKARTRIALRANRCPQTTADFMTDTPQQLLTLREVAQTLRISYFTARKWVVSGRLPSIALGPCTRRVCSTQLAKFISANTTGGN
jgi:excisionase family DNA binding protein